MLITLLGISIKVKLLHFSKAETPMFATLLEIATETKPVQL